MARRLVRAGNDSGFTHFRSVSVFCLLAFTCSVAQAAPKAPAPPRQLAPDPLLVPWLLAGKDDRDSLLADLRARPAQAPTARTLALLTQAQASLLKPALDDKRAALDAAYRAMLAAQTQAHDDDVTARIFDGFLIPALRFAPTQPAYLTSRQSLLKAAFTAYQQTSQEVKEESVLRLLLRCAGDQNTRDWANVQMAALYVHQENDPKAIAALKAVHSPGMRGSAVFIPALRREIADRYAFDHPGAAGTSGAAARPTAVKRSDKRRARYSDKTSDKAAR